MTQSTSTSQTTSHTIPTSHLHVHTEQAGSGPPVVFLHGVMGSGAVWQPYVPALAERYTLILPDMRGHGQTENPGGSIETATAAGDVIALLDALGHEQAALVGWSGGGDVALNVAQRYPERVRALVVGGVTLRLSSGYRGTLRAMGLDGPGQVDFERAARTIPHLIATWQETHRQSPTHWQDLLRQLSPEMWDPPLPEEEALKAITAPALILWGDRDQFLPVEDALALYRLLPNAELCIVPRADHFVTRTHVDSVAPAIAGFLDRAL